MDLRALTLIGLLAATPALADGDAAKGQTLFAPRCGTCHVLSGPAGGRIGPAIGGIVGQPSGKVAGFAYSKGLADGAVTWNDELLERFLATPTRAVPGTKMPMGIANAGERADIIAYLKTTKP